jgi:hypothetical protein
MPRPIAPSALALALALAPGLPALAAPADQVALEQTLAESVRPFVTRYCTSCHAGEKAKGDLDLSTFTTLDSVVKGHRRWVTIAEALKAGEMPPEKAKAQPTGDERARVLAWIEAVRRYEGGRNAGDPGPVLARRLSNAEYDYTVRDLLGVDLRPTREFPVDPANEAGFDNSGESLAMSPALLKKYLEAAREVANHLVLLPEGFAFAPEPVVSETDRDKYAVRRIIDFYQRQPTDLARYFAAAWRHRHRAALGQPRASLATIAEAEGVGPRYLALVTRTLTDASPTWGPLAEVQARWRALPAPTPGSQVTPAVVTKACEELRDLTMAVREPISKRWKNLQLKAVATGAQPFILWKNRQFALHRTRFDPAQLWVRGPNDTPASVGHARAVVAAEALSRVVEVGLGVGFPSEAFVALLGPASAPDPALAIPAEPAAQKRYLASFARFAKVFPDAFYVSERGRMHLDRSKEKQDKGRWLSAGFHNMFGFFRDDLPLYEYVLDAAGRRELDRLWQELDFVTHAPARQHADFIFYERAEPPRTIKGPEFDFIRSEDRSSASAAMIQRLAKLYVQKAKESLAETVGDAESIPVLENFFVTVNRNLRRVERARAAAEPSHLRALLRFAERAYRRPLRVDERAELLAFYRTARDNMGEDAASAHEEAMRDTIASILVSPHFLYRVDLVAGGGVQPLSQHALASRLSYFLWSSLPDQRLLDLAAHGRLQRPEVLAAEARRMLRDPRARALAVEFAGNWLDFRRFEEHNAVDRGRFPSFDDRLRKAMFEEPVRFFANVVEHNDSVLDFLYADHTFVNAPLARHYGMADVKATDEAWVRVDGAGRYGRGGILPMAAFLTRNSPGLRTSPVKRGYWVVRRVLGEVIPPPPPQVPDLPNDEKDMGHLTLRQVLEQHRRDPACAGCHARFDSFGLAFEAYGPIGEGRRKDLGGRPVDARVEFPGGGAGTGLDGLRGYVKAQRQDDFVENLVRKLASYGLGRGLILSDEPFIAEARAQLGKNGFRFGALVESIVKSAQFRTKRGREQLVQGE